MRSGGVPPDSCIPKMSHAIVGKPLLIEELEENLIISHYCGHFHPEDALGTGDKGPGELDFGGYCDLFQGYHARSLLAKGLTKFNQGGSGDEKSVTLPSPSITTT